MGILKHRQDVLALSCLKDVVLVRPPLSFAASGFSSVNSTLRKDLVDRMTARSITFCSSRILPGQ